MASKTEYDNGSLKMAPLDTALPNSKSSPKIRSRGKKNGDSLSQENIDYEEPSQTSSGGIPYRHMFGLPKNESSQCLDQLKENVPIVTAELKKLINTENGVNGLAIIVSHSGTKNELEGVIHDHDLTKKTFKQLNFAIIERQNVPFVDIGYLVKAVSEYEDFPKSYKTIVFVYCGHGSNKRISDGGKDSMPILDVILNPLCDKRFSPQLTNIAKVFFFDCCRGGNRDPGHGRDDPPSKEQKISLDIVPSCGNYLIAYSTMCNMVACDGYDNKGSIWTACLMEHISTSTDTLNNTLIDVTQSVISSMADDPDLEHIQQTVVISTLRERVHLKEPLID